MIPSNAITLLRAALAGGLLALAIGSCGRVADEEPLQIDSNTNWLMRCESDAQCSGSLHCFCGQCSQPCANTDECSLLAGAECAATEGAVCGAQPAVGGLCVLGCRESAECGPDFMCTANQCLPKPCTAQFQSWDEVLQQVAADLAGLAEEDAVFARYVSLANHPLSAACDGTLRQERHALSKALNSLSNSPTITAPLAIDVAETLYRIDLRDYRWDESVREGGGLTYQNAWQALGDKNPLAVRFVGSQADAAVTRSGDLSPVMFANSLIATAMRTDLYSAIVGVPGDYRVLLAQLGIDRLGTATPESRAGFSDRTELIATHWNIDIRTGYLWEIVDVAGPAGALFEDPLRTAAGERAVIYTLPNGLQAFAYMGADSRRLSDSAAFLDVNVSNFRATAPVSLLRAHSPRVTVRDEVLDFVAASPERFSPEVRAAISDVYLERRELEALLDDEADTFVRAALARARVPVTIEEPISATVDAYDRDVTLQDVAAELMITPDDLSDNLNLLDPAFAVLDGGAMDRNDFEMLFRQALCVLAAVNENQPAPDLCDGSQDL